MGTLLSYSGLSTKIRAMESQLINTEQLQEIVEMTNESQIVSYLKKQPGYARLWAVSYTHLDVYKRQLSL